MTRKTSASAVLLAGIAMLLAACGGGSSDSPGFEAGAPQSAGPVATGTAPGPTPVPAPDATATATDATPVSAPVSAPGRGSLIGSPTLAANVTVAQLTANFQSSVAGQVIVQLAGEPKCGIDTHYLEYGTIGAKREATNATTAVMVPTGADPACTGPRPVLVYAHGTNLDKTYNLARWFDATQPATYEGQLLAAFFAAQGYIVVAPNYAGYDRSTLPYHPYINGDQQGKDVVDALAAARKGFAGMNANASSALFLTGYSQGGYVAMAAHREMQATGQAVTAAAPLSAPSAISLLVDYTFQGSPMAGGTAFLPFMSASWQRQFGNVYDSPAEIYEPQYATGIENLLPSPALASLRDAGRLPLSAQFPADATPGPFTPALAFNYGANNLVRQSYLTQVAADITAAPCPGNALPATATSLSSASPLACAPTNGLRRAAVANDLRNWVPKAPVMLCGGAEDPVVNFASTQATAGYFRANGMPATALAVVDLEDGSSTDAYAPLRAGFAQAKQLVALVTPGSAADKAVAVMNAYHSTLGGPFCIAAARGFFQGVQAASGG